MENSRNGAGRERNLAILLMVMAVACAGGCRKSDQSLARRGFAADTVAVSNDDKDSVAYSSQSPDSGLFVFFDSIGTALSGDFDGDGKVDTARGVRVRSSGSMDRAPFRKTTLDTTSPYEDLCGGWGVFLVLGKQATSTERIYFCGQQARVQDFSWVGKAKLDTLPFPELKAKAGKGVNDVLTLFSQAGINVYLYFDGMRFDLYEPDDEP